MNTLRMLAVATGLLELGILVATAVVHVRRPSQRKQTAVILGAVTPVLALYAIAGGVYAFDGRGAQSLWALSVLWFMLFGVFVAALFVGAVAAMSPVPTNLYLRYSFGLALVVSIGVCVELSEVLRTAVNR